MAYNRFLPLLAESISLNSPFQWETVTDGLNQAVLQLLYIFTSQAFETWSAGTQTCFGLDVNTDGNNCKGKKWRDILKGALLRLSLEGFSWILERFKVEGTDRKIIAFFLQKNMHGSGSDLYTAWWARFGCTAWWARSALQRYCTENWKNISRKETARPQSQFLRSYTLYSVSERFKYSLGWSAYLAAAQ